MERGVISSEQLNIAIGHQKNTNGTKLLGQVLIDLNFATEKDIAQALTCQYGFPYLPLANYSIESELVELLPQEMCLRHMAIVIDKIGKSLTLAMSNPLDERAVQEIEDYTGCVVQIFVSTPSEIKKTISEIYTQ